MHNSFPSPCAYAVPASQVGPIIEQVFGGLTPEQELESLIAVLQQFGSEVTFDQLLTSVAAVAGARSASRVPRSDQVMGPLTQWGH
jgi:hypothetical protein|eukprot:SAG25_NODE_1149_length_3785_cov_3.788931_5_plen_86_part_00